MLNRNEIIAASCAGAFVVLCIIGMLSLDVSLFNDVSLNIANEPIDNKLFDEVAFIKLGTYGNI